MRPNRRDAARLWQCLDATEAMALTSSADTSTRHSVSAECTLPVQHQRQSTTGSGLRDAPEDLAQCIGIKMDMVIGNPDPGLISPSYVDRKNLTMRTRMRRFTRLTNGFSKKVENHAHAISLHFAYYNFCKIHQTLRTTPAMAAGVTDRLWEIEDLLALLDVTK